MTLKIINSKDLDNYLEKENKVEAKFKELESYARQLEGFSYMSIQDASTLFNYKDNIRAFYFDDFVKGSVLRDFLDNVSCFESEVSYSIREEDGDCFIKILVTIN
jgi:hypothetical protein|nr:MAG TPA: hypothetical protein [Caudoviricetes sp.]